MKRKNTIILAGILIMGLITPVFSNAEEMEGLNLETLEAILSTTNMDIIQAQQAVEIAELEVEIAHDNRYSGGDTLLEKKMNRGYNEEAAAVKLRSTTLDFENTKETVILQGIQDYFDYLLTQDEIGIEEAALIRLETELTHVNKKIELGLAIEKDALDKELEIMNQELVISGLKHHLESLALSLNNSLLWDISTTIEVIDTDIPEAELEKDDIAAVVEEAMENSETVKLLYDYYELADSYLDTLRAARYNRYDDNERIALEEARDDIENKERDIIDGKRQFEYDIRSKYNDVLNARNTLAIAEMAYENLQYNYEIMNKRYELGLEISTTVQAKEEEMNRTRLDVEQAKVDLYVITKEFNNLIN